MSCPRARLGLLSLVALPSLVACLAGPNGPAQGARSTGLARTQPQVGPPQPLPSQRESTLGRPERLDPSLAGQPSPAGLLPGGVPASFPPPPPPTFPLDPQPTRAPALFPPGTPLVSLGLGFSAKWPAGRWHLGPALLRPRAGLGLVSLEGKLYALEGEHRPSLERLDASQWSLANGYDLSKGVRSTADVEALDRGRSRLGAVAHEGDLWVTPADTLSMDTEGIRAGTFLLRYDPNGPVGPCPVQALVVQRPQRHAQAVGVLGGKLLAAGGTTDELSVSAGVQSFALAESRGPNQSNPYRFATTSVAPEMPLAVAGAAGVVLGERFYVLGGYALNEAGEALPQRAVQVYDGEAWTRDGRPEGPPPLPEALHSAAAVAKGDRIYLLGGSTGGGQVSAKVWSWAPGGPGAWQAEPELPTPRALLAAALHEEAIWTAGGVDAQGRTLRAVEVLP